MNSLTFNGYRLDVTSGLRFSANVTGSRGPLFVNEGNYVIRLAEPGPKLFLLGKPKPSNQTPTKRNKLPIESSHFAVKPFLKPAFLYDFDAENAFGIKVDASFFSSPQVTEAVRKGTQLTLAVKYAAPWMQVAEAEISQKEVTGAKANPRIHEYFKSSKFWGKDDSGGDNAWCASFVSWVMTEKGYTPPNAAFRAKTWADFGKKLSQPVYGAIGVKSRKGGGHVAFVVGKSSDSKHLFMLGGNQGDEVNISRYSRDVWDTFVVPSGYDASNDSLPVYSKAAAQAGSES